MAHAIPPIILLIQFFARYDVYNHAIYGSGKHDVNCVLNIVRADIKLKHVLVGELSSAPSFSTSFVLCFRSAAVTL